MNNPLNQPNQFKNPWPINGGYLAGKHIRLQVDLPSEEGNFFRSINPTKGAMQTTINILLSKLKQQLIQYGITNVSELERFNEYVANCSVVGIPSGGTITRPLPKTPPSNDVGGKTTTSRKGKKSKE